MTRLTALWTRSRWRTALWAAVATLSLGTGLACDRSLVAPREVGPDGRAMGRVAVVVPVGSQQATTVVVTVSAPDISPAMVFNFPVVSGVATGSVSVPAGGGRLVTVSAFDGSTETHRGQTVLTISAGANPTANITLVPLAGTVPITATVGSVVITVTPATSNPKVGDTLRFSAVIRDAFGNVVPGPARWASTQTAKVTVDTAGLATMVDTGTALVVATYSTSAATASVVVQPAAAGPVASYLRTWVGGAGTGSQRFDWANPNNWAPSFVPTQNDSVVIAPSSFNPNIPIDTFTVRDLVLRDTLNAFCCSIRLRVKRVASGEAGAFFGSGFSGLLMLNGSSVRGNLPTLVTVPAAAGVVAGDSATLGNLTIDGAASSFALAGKRVRLTGSVFVNNGGLLQLTQAADTLDVSGNFQITTSAAAHQGSLTAGTVILRGGSNSLEGYQATGTHTTVMAGTLAQGLYNMDFSARPANALQNLVVAGAGGINNIYYNVRVQGTMNVLAGAGPITSSFYTLRVDGVLTTAPGTSLTGSMTVQLMDTSGTRNVAGAWAPGLTSFYAPNAFIKAGLAYQGMLVGASMVITDSVRVAGQLQVDQASTVLDLNSPRRVTIGSLLLSASGRLRMTHPTDTLVVLGDFNTNSGGTSAGFFTDGVVQLGGNVFGGQYSPSGNHLTVFNGGGTGAQGLYSFNPSASVPTGLNNVLVSNAAGVSVQSGVRVNGFFNVTAPVAVTGACCSALTLNGPISTVAGSTVNPYWVQLGHVSGTNRVQGAWSPSYTDITTPGDTVKPGLAYNHLRFFASDSLVPGASYQLGNDLYVDQPGVVLGIRGAKVAVGANFQVSTGARFTMAGGDTITVNGNTQLVSATQSVITAGVLTMNGQSNNLSGLTPSGTFKARFASTSIQQDISGTDPSARPFVKLELAGTQGTRIFSSLAVTDTFLVSAVGANSAVTAFCCGTPEARGPFVVGAGSTFTAWNFNLAGTATLQGVSGTFIPGNLTIATSAPNALKNGPGIVYSNITFSVPYTLTDTLTTVQHNLAPSGPFGGSVAVNSGQFDLNGFRMRLAGGLDQNSGGFIKMAQAKDTLIAGDGTSNGTNAGIYLDGGGVAQLQAGTMLLNGFLAVTNVNSTTAHTIILSDSGYAPGTRSYGITGSGTIGNLVIRGSSGYTITTNAGQTVAGNFTLGGQANFQVNCCTAFRVQGVVSTAAGTTVTGGSSGVFEVQSPSGTANVNGTWAPFYTRFAGVGATIKPTAGNPGIQYQNVDCTASCTFSGRTSIATDLSATGAGVVLNTGGQVVTAGRDFGLGSGATLAMNSNNDTLLVFRNFTSDNGSVNSNVTSGVIRVKGDINAFRLNPSGNNWLIVDSSSTITGNQQLYTNNGVLNRVQVRSLRPVINAGSFITFNDTVQVLSPTTFGSSACCSSWNFNGPLITVAGSTVQQYNTVLGHATGTSLIAGNYAAPNTFFNVPGTINPALAYQNVTCNVSCSLSGRTTATGLWSVANNGSVMTFAGKTLSTGSFYLTSSGVMSMTNALDTLIVGATQQAAGWSFNSDNGQFNSSPSAGVIRVKGDVNAFRLNPGGTHVFLLDSLVSGAAQQLYTNGGVLNRLEVITNRSVNTASSITFNDSVFVRTPIVYGTTACCQTHTFNKALTTVAGSSALFNNLTLADSSYLGNVAGSVDVGTGMLTLQAALPGTVPSASRFTYRFLTVNTTASLALGATLQLGGGPTTGNTPGDLTVNNSALLIIPSTSTLRVCRNLSIASGVPVGTVSNSGVLTVLNNPGTTILNRITGNAASIQACP
jgi:hypothetical protein